jgi:aminoglycoside phosphotransferase (APT) family kinase protein
VELLASGRMAEVFAWADGRVLKLDRVEWNGVSALEMSVLETVTAAGVPAPRPYETVMVDERHGLVMDRVDGPILATVVADATDAESLAATWTEMHGALNTRVVAGLPDLVTSLADGVRSSGLAELLVEELLALLATIDDGERRLCHFDLHPGNVIAGPDGWVVIDWLTASSGPAAADLARTLVLDPPGSGSPKERFMTIVARQGLQARGLDRARLDAWVRVIAAARISEGFEGAYADFLGALASGARRLDV